MLAYITGLSLPFGKIVPNTFRVQSEASSPSIIRATFRILFSDYSERVEIVFDRSKQQILSYRLLDLGFSEIDGDIVKALNADVSAYLARPAVRELKETFDYLQGLNEFKGSIVRQVLVRSSGEAY